MNHPNQNCQNSSPSKPPNPQYLIKLMTNGVLSTIQVHGFDIPLHEKQYKSTFNSSLFIRPNPKAFEVIIHFLLTKLDPERAEKAFSTCWPVVSIEQQKFFKDVIVPWLLELSQKANRQQSQPTQQPNQSQSLLQSIRFPIVSKSLLSNPGGFKICELLFSLSQYVLVVRLTKLSFYHFLDTIRKKIIFHEFSFLTFLKVDSSKSNTRILPKLSPFYSSANQSDNQKPPFSQSQNTNSAMSGSSNQTSSSKLISQKQLLHLDIQTSALKRKIEFEMNDFNLFSHKQFSFRTNCLQYTQLV